MRTFLIVLTGGAGGALCMFCLRISGLLKAVDGAWAAWISTVASPAITTTVSPEGSFLLGVLLSFVLGWVAVDVPRQRQSWLVGLLAMALLGTGGLVLALYGTLFFPAAPALGIFFGLAIASTLTRIGPGRFRRKVEEIFASSVSRASLRQLYDVPASELFVAGRREVSALRVETANHGRLMEVMTPEDFAGICRVYFSLAGNYLAESGGYLESCGGSGVKAIFGAPITRGQTAEKACMAALDLTRRIERLNLEADSRWHHILEFHIGIATGSAVTRAFPGARRAPFLVSGPPAPLATRLCHACGIYGCRILICMETHRLVSNLFEVRPIDLVSVDPDGDLEIYELLCAKGGLSPERKRSRDHFWTGVNHVRARKWDEAVAEFARARIQGIPDPPLDYYLQRIERERKGGESGVRDLAGL